MAEEKTTTATTTRKKTATTAAENTFCKLLKVDVSSMLETKKQGGTELSYLSWPLAWAEFKKACPKAQYEIVKNERNLPFFDDPVLGYMVYTRMTNDGETWYEMWLPVMDSSNKAMKAQAYTYKVWDYQSRTWYEKTVKAADIFDVNKAVMRCLVKNMAMFGLGLSVYAGEDIPAGDDEPEERPTVDVADDPVLEVIGGPLPTQPEPEPVQAFEQSFILEQLKDPGYQVQEVSEEEYRTVLGLIVPCGKSKGKTLAEALGASSEMVKAVLTQFTPSTPEEIQLVNACRIVQAHNG